jgi:hypothetical protein
MLMGGVVKQLKRYFVCDTVFEVWVKLLIQRIKEVAHPLNKLQGIFHISIWLLV